MRVGEHGGSHLNAELRDKLSFFFYENKSVGLFHGVGSNLVPGRSVEKSKQDLI